MTLARNVLLAAALAVVLGGLVAAPEHPSLWSFALAVGVATVVYMPRQRFRVRGASFVYGWCEAALIIALQLVPAGWAPLALGAGHMAYAGLRWLRDRSVSPRMIPVNAASHVLSAGVGAALCALVVDPYQSPPTPAVTGGLLLAAVGYFAVMQVVGAGLVGLRAGVSIWQVYERAWRYELPMFGGSVAIGLTAVAAAYYDWRWLLLLPALLSLVNWTYAFRVKSGERRRMWSALTDATRSLNQPDEASVAAAGIRGAMETFTVGQAEIEVWRKVRGRPVAQGWSDPRRSGSRQGGVNGTRRAWAGDLTGEVRRVAGDGERGTVVPLTVEGVQIGLLRVHFPVAAGPSSGERAALQVYADALAAALSDTATHEALHKVLARSIHDAQHDPLTGLLNRSALLARGETVVQLLPHAQPVALLLVNVDHFREINDTLGHAAGDQVLAVTAERLRGVAQKGDLVGRLGGDEFAVLVTGAITGPGGPQHDAVRRGQELVRLLAEEATISGVPVSVEASVGVVVAPAGTADVTELLRRADAAMQQAKHGGGTVGWYDSACDAGSSDRPAMLAELRSALDREDELVLVLQPVVELATGAPTGVEALVRWHHPSRGLLPPAEFVRAVENSDLLGVFTEYVIDKALAAAAGWASAGPAVPVAVNLSARSLLDPRLPQAVAALLRRHRVPGRRLILEITESAVTSELPGIDEALGNLRALGVRLAVDDFGTGYASLTFLTRIPLDEVKVDGSFVTQMSESPEAAAIIRATVELGRDLGMRVVAEGVETAAQRSQLTTLGCPAGQGFYLACPTSVERIGETLHRLDAAAVRADVVPLAAPEATASPA